MMGDVNVMELRDGKTIDVSFMYNY
jgi:hypothetical protein